jgi:alkylated DNA repair dioxygenase AlkB
MKASVGSLRPGPIRLHPAQAAGGRSDPGVVEPGHREGGSKTRIGQVLCPEYDVGVGIGWHRDKPHFGRVFGLSLGSPCKFRFRKPVGTKWERFTLEARPRSIYMMAGPSREVWEHSIPAVEERRHSITFRTMAARS